MDMWLGDYNMEIWAITFQFFVHFRRAFRTIRNGLWKPQAIHFKNKMHYDKTKNMRCFVSENDVEKTGYKWAATWQNQQSECAPSEYSDHPGHPPSLIRVFAVRMKKAWVLSCPLSAQRRLWSDWADAQGDLSLRWAHIHFVGFVMSRLKYEMIVIMMVPIKVSSLPNPLHKRAFTRCHWLLILLQYETWTSFNICILLDA